jgi:hypothetical protein
MDQGNMMMDYKREEISENRHSRRLSTGEYSSCSSATAVHSKETHRQSIRKPPEAKETMERAHDDLLSQVQRAMKGERIGQVEELLQRMWKDTRMDPACDVVVSELPPRTIREELLGTRSLARRNHWGTGRNSLGE